MRALLAGVIGSFAALVTLALLMNTTLPAGLLSALNGFSVTIIAYHFLQLQARGN